MRHRGGCTWRGVKTEPYKAEDGSWSGVLRRTLAGDRGEDVRFHLRYFEIAPGGSTTYETHRHEHVVICLRGRGRCLVGNRPYDVAYLDVLYVPPHAPHRLYNPFDEPFGFLCAVDAERDRPVACRTSK